LAPICLAYLFYWQFRIYHGQVIEVVGCKELLFRDLFLLFLMEDGGVDTTIIKSQQHKMCRLAGFLPLLASSVFDL
jgi:hypothetical protein